MVPYGCGSGACSRRGSTKAIRRLMRMRGMNLMIPWDSFSGRNLSSVLSQSLKTIVWPSGALGCALSASQHCHREPLRLPEHFRAQAGGAIGAVSADFHCGRTLTVATPDTRGAQCRCFFALL